MTRVVRRRFLGFDDSFCPHMAIPNYDTLFDEDLRPFSTINEISWRKPDAAFSFGQ